MLALLQRVGPGRLRRPARHRRREVRARRRGAWSSRCASGRRALQPPARALQRRARQARCAAQGHLPLAFYPSFAKDDDPTLGLRATACRRRASARRTGRCATASACWWRRTRWKHVRAPGEDDPRRAASRCCEAPRDDGRARYARDGRSGATRRPRSAAAARWSLAWRPPARSGPSTSSATRTRASRRRSPASSGSATTTPSRRCGRCPASTSVRPGLTRSRAEGRLPRARGARGAGWPKLELHGVALRGARRSRCRLAVEVFRATEAKFRAATVRGAPARRRCKGAWTGRDAHRCARARSSSPSRSRRARWWCTCSSRGARLAASRGASSTRRSSRRNTWRTTSPKSRAKMLARIPPLKAEFDRSSATTPRSRRARGPPPLLLRAPPRVGCPLQPVPGVQVGSAAVVQLTGSMPL